MHSIMCRRKQVWVEIVVLSISYLIQNLDSECTNSKGGVILVTTGGIVYEKQICVTRE